MSERKSLQSAKRRKRSNRKTLEASSSASEGAGTSFQIQIAPLTASHEDTNVDVDGIIVNRFWVPYNLECKGCTSVIAEGVKLQAFKEPIGIYCKETIWRYTIECAYCGEKIVMERFGKGSKFKITKGALKKKVEKETEETEEETKGERRQKRILAYLKKVNKAYYDAFAPGEGLHLRYDFMKIHQIGFVPGADFDSD